jgi:hypothetical protein
MLAKLHSKRISLLTVTARMNSTTDHFRMPSSKTGAKDILHIATTILCGLVLGLYVLRLFRELWLDEYGTAWVTGSDWHQLLIRNDETLPHSKLFYIVSWVFRKLLGASPFALRLPSFVLSLATALLVKQLGSRLFNRSVGELACMLFALGSLAPILFENARPYGLATFCTALCTLSFLRWIEKPSIVSATLYGLTGALVVNAHIFYAILLPCHCLWLCHLYAAKSATFTSSMIVQYLLALLLAALLSYPALHQTLMVIHRKDELNFLNSPGLETLVLSFMPLEFLTIMGIVLGARIIGTQRIWDLSDFSRSHSSLPGLLFWMLVPPFTLYLMGLLLNCPLLLPRYFAHQAIPTALISAWILSSIAQRLERPAIILLPLTFFLILATARVVSNLDEERWQSALYDLNASLDKECPILIQPGLVESQNTSLYPNPMWRGYLTHLANYSEEGIKPTLIPYSFMDTSTNNHLRDVVLPLAHSHECVGFAYRNAVLPLKQSPLGTIPLPAVETLTERLQKMGYTIVATGNYGLVDTIVWHRPSSNPTPG